MRRTLTTPHGMGRFGVRATTVTAIASLAFIAPMAAAQDTTTVTPAIPPTVNAKSPFLADRPSSEPLGLAPNQTTDPFTYPSEPVVLEWTPVPGAVEYHVEISSNPGFTQIVWRADTDGWLVAPEALLPDGVYWWRVTAVDAAGTKGVVSEAAQFAKSWPATIDGAVLSGTPGGAATSLIRITPYMRWNEVPGARTYDTQIAPADQFATPAFWSWNFPVTAMSPAEAGVLPDDGYTWRVRAADADRNPGPWVTMTSFTKAWVAPEIEGPADGATVNSLYLHWKPVAGAEKYEVQMTAEEHNWQGNSLELNATTASTGLVPTLDEMRSKSIGYGQHWWRVRPMVSGVPGTWTEAQHLTYAAPSAPTATAQLTAAANSETALTPHMIWTNVTGATIYRIDIATDVQFNNVVESQITTTPGWVPRAPLADNQSGQGYYWRVLWGTGATADNPHWQVSETQAPRGDFTKQTAVTLGSAATGVVTEPPMFTWSDVAGSARYELQISRSAEFDGSATQSMTVWGTGTEWAKDKGKRLPSGTWFWRVRAMDAAGHGLTWSRAQTFALNPPRPEVSKPADGAVVVGAPLMQWAAVNAACQYQVQVADSPAYPAADSDSAPPPGSFTTKQVAAVASGKYVTKPGTWYWRVRADFCDNDFGPWSPSRSFVSVRPPQFNLNRVPTRASYGSRLVVAGKLVHNGVPVRRPRLLVERRADGETGFSPYGTVNGDASGRFAFSLRQTRSAAWRVRWVATDTHPEGLAPFVVRVVPRVAFRLGTSRVERKRPLTISGSVYPKRGAVVQVRTSTGWEDLLRIPAAQRFRVRLRAAIAPGNQQLRLYVPGDGSGRLDAVGSVRRSLLVFDRFVLR